LNRVTALCWAADIWHFPKKEIKEPDADAASQIARLPIFTVLGELQ